MKTANNISRQELEIVVLDTLRAETIEEEDEILNEMAQELDSLGLISSSLVPASVVKYWVSYALKF